MVSYHQTVYNYYLRVQFFKDITETLIIKLHICELLKCQSPRGWCSSTTEVLNRFSENNWQIDWQSELHHMYLLITDFINY